MKQNGGWTAEVTPPDGSWKSPYPMMRSELEAALESVGCHQEAINAAFSEGFFEQYRSYAKQVEPLVRAVLDGSRKVVPQSPSVEAWLAYALFFRDEELTIQQLIMTADEINHLIPSPDEISWALLQLRKREWLADNGNRYKLTPEGRDSIAGIVGHGEVLEELERLKEWVSSHPPFD